MPGHESLAHQTRRAAGWALAGTVAGRLVSLGAVALLARWLAPTEFGLLAFALVYIAYVETIADLGATAALIYSPAHTRDQLARVTFLISVAMSIVWLAISWILAPQLAAFFHQEAATPILRALAWALPLRAFGATHDALAQKALRFRARVVPELGLSVVKAAVAVPLAAAGLGVWSLVWGHLAGAATWTLLAWTIVPWRPRWPSSREPLRPLLAYGRGIVGVNMLAAVLHHADFVVVGRMLGASALGFYQMASRLPEMTLILLVHVTGKVLFPAFAIARAEERPVGRVYLSVLRLLAIIVLPAAAVLVFLADPLVIVIFGPRWEPAIPILRALAIYAAFRALGSHGGDVLKALGRSGLLAGLGGVKAMMLVPLIVYAARFGAVGVAAGMAAAYFLNLLLTVEVLKRLAGVAWRDFASALRPAIFISAGISITLGIWNTVAGEMTPWLHLMGGGALALTIFGLAARVAAPDLLDTLTSNLRTPQVRETRTASITEAEASAHERTDRTVVWGTP